MVRHEFGNDNMDGECALGAVNHEVDPDGKPERRRTISPLAIRVLALVIVCSASIFILGLIGATPILILEVFGLAALLAVSAVLIVIFFARAPVKFRKGPEG